MKYKRIFALLLAAAMVFSLAACGETAAGPEATPDPAADGAATVSGQTLTFGDAADDVFSLSLDYEESLNPVKTQSTLNQLVDCLVYDRLFEHRASSRTGTIPKTRAARACGCSR